MEKICTWQYVLCIELWVKFISAHILDFDLKGLLHSMIQIINEIAYLFPTEQYIPLRLKCVQWLNDLSSAGRIFIPIASFALDVLEYASGNASTKLQSGFDVSKTIKARLMLDMAMNDAIVYYVIVLTSSLCLSCRSNG